jgi:methyl-accepting chemotaxis protein
VNRTRTFGQKIGSGFGALVLLAMLIAGVAIVSLRMNSRSNEALVEHARELHAADLLRSLFERKVSAYRSYLLTREPRHLEQIRGARAELEETLRGLTAAGRDAELAQLLREIGRLEAEHEAVIEGAIARLDGGGPVLAGWVAESAPAYDATVAALDALSARSRRLLDAEQQAAARRAGSGVTLLGAITLAALVATLSLAVFLTRTLTRQVAAAIQHLQSSSAELEASSRQQATTSKQQASTSHEVTTTVRELLSTSRQIAESAQRVVRIAEQTAAAAERGDRTVQKAQEGIGGIRRQVDVIVRHMLELGRKSQEIGTILEIIDDLSEQTNILAINATIEAAGAGEAGKRFAVVADEIRKLADRVGGATKDVVVLIDEIRAAAGTTVMATEQGSKAVDAGAHQFGEVTASFGQIAALVTSTTEAAREIELSTRQQATAVEQVNLAIVDLTHSAAELDESSHQTVEIAGKLASLSDDLARIVRPTPRRIAA